MNQLKGTAHDHQSHDIHDSDDDDDNDYSNNNSGVTGASGSPSSSVIVGSLYNYSSDERRSWFTLYCMNVGLG